MSPRCPVVLFVCALTGCAAQSSIELDGSDMTAPPSTSVPDADRSAAPTASSAEPADAPRAARDACVMLYECGCNSSCVTVDQPRLGFREGDLVMVKSGGLKGTEVYAIKNKTALGKDVWTVQRADPRDGVQACGGPDARRLIGYACATSNSGPPRACASCEEE